MDNNLKNQNNFIDLLIYKELNIHLKLKDNSKLNTSIYDVYPDFNWELYKELNPYLYILGLRTKSDYENNYLLDGRYRGRAYKKSEKKKYSFHVLLATVGKDSIFTMLNLLMYQLNENDYLTIVFDGSENTKNLENVKNFVNDFVCNITIIIEENNLGYWGHGIRNKHNNLEGDFVFHIDDDDIILEDTFEIIRKHCKNIDTVYIFKIILENNDIIWKKKNIEINKISTQCGIIPTHINKNGYWELKYGGDYNFYKELSKTYDFLFIDKIIYKKI
jgi:phosphotransferase system HPr-like phosphotransfer protein